MKKKQVREFEAIVDKTVSLSVYQQAYLLVYLLGGIRKSMESGLTPSQINDLLRNSLEVAEKRAHQTVYRALVEGWPGPERDKDFI